jgi:uncharacterized protein DUF5676
MKQFRELTRSALARTGADRDAGPRRVPPLFAGDGYEIAWEKDPVPVVLPALANTSQKDWNTPMSNPVSKPISPFVPPESADSAPASDRLGPRIPIVILGLSLGIFLSLSFILCVLFDLWFPSYAMYSAWAVLLPGFTWITWPSLLLGLVETFAYGWYFALLFGGIYNFLTRRSGAVRSS